MKGFVCISRRLRDQLILNKGSTLFYVFKNGNKQESKWLYISKIAMKVDVTLSRVLHYINYSASVSNLMIRLVLLLYLFSVFVTVHLHHLFPLFETHKFSSKWKVFFSSQFSSISLTMDEIGECTSQEGRLRQP